MAVNREELLQALFARIDVLVEKDDCLNKAELSMVFGEHAEEFLKFCDGDDDQKLTQEEFVNGIINDAKDLTDEDFTANWTDRMDGVVKAAEEKKAAEAPPAEAPAAEEPAAEAPAAEEPAAEAPAAEEPAAEAPAAE